jgi:hypothetical protein
MDHPQPWLRFLDAGDVDDDTLDFDGLTLETASGDRLGSIDGFIVDSESARPYYVVADAGGWFRSKHFLIPVGHVRLDAEREALVTTLTKDRVKRFPGFDLDEFKKMTEEDLKRLNDQICEACSVTVVTYSSSEPVQAAWDRPDYAHPEWWHASSSQPDQAGDRAYRNPIDYPERPDSNSRTQQSKRRGQ